MTKVRADELKVGDRIAADYIPHGDEAEVLFVRAHEYRGYRGAERWVFVAYELRGGFHDSTSYRPEAAIEITRPALGCEDPTHCVVHGGQLVEETPASMVPAPIAEHYDASGDYNEYVCACEAAFSDQRELDQHVNAMSVVDGGQLVDETSAETPGRQFCRTGIHPCISAVTLTFRNGAGRLHWCAEHAADADAYRANADEAADRRTCVDPGDQEHDHATCEDVLAEDGEREGLVWDREDPS